MSSVTVITPLARYHRDKLGAVRATVAAQTIPCHHMIVADNSQRGAGYARNVGLRRVTTDFVVFLDADDWLEPTFLKRCLDAFDGRRYVYTDWRQGDEHIEAPCLPWVDRTWHCITTLLRTEWVRAAGGFDETLPGGEDTDLYLKLTTSGVCGQRLAEPLFHYGRGGRRAAAFVHGPDYQATLDEFTRRYGGKRMACNGCGDRPNTDLPPAGEKQPGDVLVMATWGGNRRERGPVTGRLYPRAGNGARLWVAPEDVDYAPHLWRRLQDPLPTPVRVTDGAQYSAEVIDADTEQPLDNVEDVARAMFPGLQPAPPQPIEPVAVKPNFSRVRDLAKRSGAGAAKSRRPSKAARNG